MNKLITDFCRHFNIDETKVNAPALTKELQQLANKYKLTTAKPAQLATGELDLSLAGQHIAAYSDGACSGNPGRGGWGVVICYPNQEVHLSGAEKQTTNNRMELQGAIEALKHIQQQALNLPVSITTDSQYVKSGITQWIFGWKKNGWKTASKEPVKNQDLWQALDQLQQQLQPHWHWIKGHAGHHYNEECDRLAVIARDELI